MSTKDAITNGIAAHGMWKQRLISAIKTGQSEWTPEIVCQDDQCEFGKWLYSCSPEEKSSPYHSKITQLHANFHKTAAVILDLALQGKTSEAEEKIGMASEYKDNSARLTREMMNWKNELP